MGKRGKTIIILIVIAVVAYFAYRWYLNQSSANSGMLAGNTSGAGSNLNSVAPELAAGSAGPTSGLNYTPGNSTIDITLPTNAPTAVNDAQVPPAPASPPASGSTGWRGTPIPAPVRKGSTPKKPSGRVSTPKRPA